MKPTQPILQLNPTFLIALLVAGLSLPALGQVKIAVIDLSKVFDNYYKTKLASESMKQRSAELSKEDSALTAQHEKATEEYRTAVEEANNMAISPSEREKRKKVAEDKLREIQDLEQSIRQFRTQANTAMEEQQRRTRDNILVEIRAVISSKAKAAGYSLVLDVAGQSINGVPVVLYHSGQTDLTDEVLTHLNANAPPTSAPAGTNK